jgi:hypothetical protein
MGYKSPHWIEFTDGTAGCTEGETEEIAMKAAETATGKTMRVINRLPYRMWRRSETS